MMIVPKLMVDELGVKNVMFFEMGKFNKPIMVLDMYDARNLANSILTMDNETSTSVRSGGGEDIITLVSKNLSKTVGE